MRESMLFVRDIVFTLAVLLAAVLVVPVLVVGGWLAHATWQEAHFDRTAVLAAGLSGEWGKMWSQFRGRIRERYPPGTPVDRLVADLDAQGFAPSTKLVPEEFAGSDADASKVGDLTGSRMSIRGPSLFCDINWVVAWDADAARRVTATYGDLRGYCL